MKVPYSVRAAKAVREPHLVKRKPPKPGGKFDREYYHREYMREYMRKVRKRQKKEKKG